MLLCEVSQQEQDTVSRTREMCYRMAVTGVEDNTHSDVIDGAGWQRDKGNMDSGSDVDDVMVALAFGLAVPVEGKAGESRPLSAAQWTRKNERKLFAHSLEDALIGLAAWNLRSGGSNRIRQVWQALVPNQALTEVVPDQVHPKSLPRWVPESAVQFLVVCAGLGLLDQLDQVDPRATEVVIRYFGSRESLSQMKGVAELGTEAGVWYMIRRGITFLWDALPEPGHPLPTAPDTLFPLDKHRLFKREHLRRNMAERNREATMQRWRVPEKREAWQRALRRRKPRN